MIDSQNSIMRAVEDHLNRHQSAAKDLEEASPGDDVRSFKVLYVEVLTNVIAHSAGGEGLLAFDRYTRDNQDTDSDYRPPYTETTTRRRDCMCPSTSY
jgi:hypothetical protein